MPSVIEVNVLTKVQLFIRPMNDLAELIGQIEIGDILCLSELLDAQLRKRNVVRHAHWLPCVDLRPVWDRYDPEVNASGLKQTLHSPQLHQSCVHCRNRYFRGSGT